MKKLFILGLSMMMCVVFGSAAEEYERGTLIVNGSVVEHGESVLFQEDRALFPLRTVFESLGATVTWDAETGDVRLEYQGRTYLCETVAPNLFYVTDETSGQTVYLNAMASTGGFQRRNGRIYLYRESMLYLLSHLDVEVEVEDRTVKISNQPTEMRGTVIVNETVLEGADSILFWKGVSEEWQESSSEFAAVFIPQPKRYPLRALCEALGAIVTWDEETGTVQIKIGAQSFLCEFAGTAYLRIKHQTSGEYLTLDASDVTAVRIEMRNGRIYLHEDGMTMLLNAMGIREWPDTETLTVELVSLEDRH